MTAGDRPQHNWHTRAALAIVVLFGIVLTLHAELSRLNLDEYGDMVENYAWGVLWQWGYFKHPPFFGWLVAAWFSILPHVDWIYYVFASLNVVVALLLLWRIAARYGDSGFQLFVVLCAVVVPAFSFQAIKYNANSAMTPVWAAVFLFYLRGLEARRWYDALALGILVGIAMLTKYHSVVLVGALFIHAIMDREARSILLSSFGFIVALASVAVFAGHLIWLFENDFLPITYAAEQGDGVVSHIVSSLALFLGGMLVYLLPALGLALLLRSPNDGYPFLWLVRLRGFRTTVEGRALLAFGLWPTVLTIALAVAASADLNLAWVLPVFLPLVVLVAALLPPDLINRNIARALIATGLYFVALLVSAPIYKESVRGGTRLNMTVPVKAMSAQLDEYWRQYGNGDDPVIAGDFLLANAMSFYSRYSPITLEANSLSVSKGYIDKAELERRGMMIICREGDGSCAGLSRELTGGLPDVMTIPFSVTGFDGERQWPFVVIIAKPLG